LRQFLPAVLFAVIVIAIAGPAALTTPQGEMAVVFPPFTDETTAWALVRAAGGMIVAPTFLDNVVIAYAVDDGFQSRIRQSGALFLFAASALCISQPEENT
jgi:hypothetical protein